VDYQVRNCGIVDFLLDYIFRPQGRIVRSALALGYFPSAGSWLVVVVMIRVRVIGLGLRLVLVLTGSGLGWRTENSACRVYLSVPDGK